MYHLFVMDEDGEKHLLVKAPGSNFWTATYKLAAEMYGKENISYTWEVDKTETVKYS